jgi:hypothetical protein
LSLQVQLPVLPAGSFEAAVDRNATLEDANRFLARVRAVGQTWPVANSLAHQVGSALRQASLTGGQVGRVNEAIPLVSTDVRSVIVDEIVWYTGIGAFQLHHANEVSRRGYATLGKTSAYYASFYFAQALSRLAGRIPLYLRDFATTGAPGPTVMFVWDGLVPAHRFFITRYRVPGTSHKALWEGYFNTWKTSPDALPDYQDVVVPQSLAADESVERNDHTYRPWFAFAEHREAAALESSLLQGAIADARSRAAFVAGDIPALSPLTTDPDLGPMARACLRGLLICKFAGALATRSNAFRALYESTRSQIGSITRKLGYAGAFAERLESDAAS